MDREFYSQEDIYCILRAVLEQFHAVAGDSRIPAHGRGAYMRGRRDAVRAFAQSLGLDPTFILVADADHDEPAVLDAVSCR